MPKTAVGLFSSPVVADAVVHELEANDFSRENIRVLGEPLGLTEAGPMSIAHIDFEVDVIRELKSIGSDQGDAEVYIQGLRHGGTIVLAAVSDAKAGLAVEIMNRHHAIEAEELKVSAPHLQKQHDSMFPGRDTEMQSGRVRSNAGGARLFVW